MEYIKKDYSDIQSVGKDGITFTNGDKIVTAACIGKRYNSAICVAERNIEFFTNYKPVRIIFNNRGLFSKYINNKNFLKLQMQINNAGYSSYDLS